MSSEDVAVIGMACRLPGAPSIPSLWRGLLDGYDAVRTYSEQELRAAGVGDDLLADPSYIRAAGHLDCLEEFDAELFRCDQMEAALMDPQHRLFLEVAWTAIEDAGHDTTRSGAVVGVFAGASENRYFLCNLLGNSAVASPLMTGPDHLPTRVSYALGLTGPSIAVQTACSTSLVAVCLAVQSLLDARCDLAIAGGASVVLPQPSGYRFVDGGRRSPDGRCRAFEAAARGSGPASGAGAVVLRRLEDAIEDGDHVYAVIEGSAINNDGAERAGYAVPGVAGQAAVVTEALTSGSVHPDTIGLVEAHGSGMPVGDAIEFEALTMAFRRQTRRVGYCALGSVRTNVGDLEAAGGVAGLIKASLAMRHGVIPPMPHFRRPNPQIDLTSSPFFVNTTPVPWDSGATGRRAGVSSFGLGGTNAHVILKAPPPRAPSGPSRTYKVLPLTARTPAALEAAQRQLRDYLAAHPELPLADVAYTLAVGRRRLACQAAVVARDTAEAVRVLDRDVAGRVTTSTSVVEWPTDDAQRVARLWVAGSDVDWKGLFGAERRQRIPLPAYPFERKRCWIDPPGPLSLTDMRRAARQI